MTDDLRKRIASRLGEAWPNLANDPVYLDQLAAQAMVVIEPEVERLNEERDALSSAIDRVRRMAQVWVDVRPTHPTATRYGHVMADAGQQILELLDHPPTPPESL